MYGAHFSNFFNERTRSNVREYHHSTKWCVSRMHPGNSAYFQMHRMGRTGFMSVPHKWGSWLSAGILTGNGLYNFVILHSKFSQREIDHCLLPRSFMKELFLVVLRNLLSVFVWRRLNHVTISFLYLSTRINY